MLCPRCQSEPREGAETCATCGTSLLKTEGSACEDETPVELVTILESSDARFFLAARSRLDGARIAHLSRGDGLRELFGARHPSGGPRRTEGPIEILVRKQDAAAAAELLATLDDEGKNVATDRGTPAP